MNLNEIRNDFPFFANNPGLCYLDNSATSQKPSVVMDAERNFYNTINSNPFRGLYDISVRATEAYEESRKKIAAFINAPSENNIVFTRNASESLNLLAYSLCDLLLSDSDEIVVSVAEHHSNLLPWQLAAKRHNCRINWLYPDERGMITPDTLSSVITDNVKIVAITAMSNVFGYEYDIAAFAEIAHKYGAVFVADGAQSVPHIRTDVITSDVDFLAFSGHKMFAPMGIGALYGKTEFFERMPPFMSGGEMIEYVHLDNATYAEVPHKFEAGTVNAGGAVAYGAAIDYINRLGFDEIIMREELLSDYMMSELLKIDSIRILGSDTGIEHHGIFTFTIDGVHPHDISAILSSDGIAVRAGHHCTQPLHKALGIMSTARASLMFYNTTDEIDRFIQSLSTVRKRMGLV